MVLKDVSLDSPSENILLDEVFLSLAETGLGGEILRFWESPVLFVVLGRIGNVGDDVCVEAAARDHVPILRRSSGGGTVLQGKGCLNYSLILSRGNDPSLDDLRRSYAVILGRIIAALDRLGVPAEFKPASDLALAENQKKFSGNAQRRARKHILHHGTLLYDFDITLMHRYLRMPRDIPAYRHSRPHTEFVANLPLFPVDIKRSIAECWPITRAEPFLTSLERSRLDEFLESKTVRADG